MDCRRIALGVALETFRTWDAGRRPAPEAIVNQAQTLRAKRPPHDRLPLQVLADELHVHVRTLRAAAHDGRLAATFGARPFFGKLTATATRDAAAQFMAKWYRRTLRSNSAAAEASSGRTQQADVLASPAVPASLGVLLAHLFAPRFAHPLIDGL